MVNRSLIPVVSLLLLAAGCSSSSDASEISFEHVFDMQTETSVWTAAGAAVDDGLLCAEATGDLQGFEDEDGTARMPEEIGALYEAGEQFVNVSVESMECADGSGAFTLRTINEIDPAIVDAVPVIASTWTITGGSGYDTTEGSGDNDLPREGGSESTTNGTGTITK